MARMNISVPDELKKRMDEVTEKVNWSDIASRAFILKIGDIATKQQEKTMENVIERLRGTKVQAEDREYNMGTDAGKAWVQNSATVPELERLMDIDLDTELFTGLMSAYSDAEILVFTLAPEYDGDRDYAAAFWESCIGDETYLMDSVAYLRGFAEGAAALYETIADEL